MAIKLRKKSKAGLSQSEMLKAYEKMLLIRVAEQKIAEYYLKNKVMSFVHFYVGQEAVAVGVAQALGPKDKMLGNHRSHGHYLAMGGDLKKMVSELLGKASGSSQGKGGSMHMIDKSVNFVGSTPILASVVPLSCGVAFEQKYNKSGGITVGFFGDGAFEEGVVYETLNLAGLFKLPLFLVVENNLFSVNSSLADRRAEGHSPEKIVEGFGAKYLKADGNNFHDVYAKSQELAAYLRSGKGPAVLECITYRHMAHSAPIFDESVRKEDVLEKRLEADPIKMIRNQLLSGGMTEKKILSLEKKIGDYVESSIEFADKAPYPDKKTLYTDMYA